METSSWIGCKTEAKAIERPTLMYFRKTVDISAVPENCFLRISADSRYKWFINGKLCQVGPLKGDHQVWFCDRMDIAPFLQVGRNVLAAIVLYYPEGTNNWSVFSGNRAGWYVEYEGEEASLQAINTNHTWKVKQVSGYEIVSENPFFAPLQIYERVNAQKETSGWMAPSYDDSVWEDAEEYIPLPEQRPENLRSRTIPFMDREKRHFIGISRLDTPKKEETQTGEWREDKTARGETGANEKKINKFFEDKTRKEENGKMWMDFLNERREICLLPHTRVSVDLDAGELTTGYLSLVLSGGAQARITLRQAECYVEQMPEVIRSFDDLPRKGDRTDSVKGLMWAYTDVYYPCGLGSCAQPERYEPFWFRTFRYVRLQIETGDHPLHLKSLHYEETGYPLAIQSVVETSDPSLHAIWDISARSLRRCMHETYEDCPFYEQLQYIMDARSQILYTYAVSADDRLARKCIDDLSRSQRADGLLAASYPNVHASVIPGFSLYYIGMLYDHMMYFGDKVLLERYRGTMERILRFFDAHREKHGLVGQVGGLNRPDRDWSFIDWTSQWQETNGVPTAMSHGPITMESLLYLQGLQYAEAICRYLGDEPCADRYADQADQLRMAIRRYCRGDNGMLQDGPGYEEYSQHAQVFGVLTDCLSPEEGRVYLQTTLAPQSKADYAQCSVAMMYYLFRALEKCAMYEQTDALWETWRDMLRQHMTTCAEDPVNSRSDCHAWGALALYELPSVTLGVRPLAPGYERIAIHPVCGHLSWAKGDVITPRGKVSVQWHKDSETGQPEGSFSCDASLRENVQSELSYRIPVQNRHKNTHTLTHP